MADPKIVRVVQGKDDDEINLRNEKGVAVVVGLRGLARTGQQGISYAGAQGQAISQVDGIAIVGPNGAALGGIGTVVCAYDGGSATGGDGAIAWARRDGPATVNNYGLASVIDSMAKGGDGSVAVALRQNGLAVTAEVGSHGLAFVHNHQVVAPSSRPATAVAASCSVAVAFDGNWVQGSVGSLLVAAYTRDGQCLFAVGVVDDTNLKAGQKYAADGMGGFVAV